MTVHITCTIIGTNTVIGEVCRALMVGEGRWAHDSSFLAESDTAQYAATQSTRFLLHEVVSDKLGTDSS